MTTITDLTEFIGHAVNASMEMPNGHNRMGWAAGPVGIHRDSDSLAKSNYRIALREMLETAGMSWDEIGHMSSSGPICARCDHPESVHDDAGKCGGVWERDTYPSYSVQPCRDQCETLETVDLYIGAFGHWGVGWIEEILWRASNERLAETAFSIFERLENYPVLSEEDYSKTEWADNHPDDNRCYVNPREWGLCECGLWSVYCDGYLDETNGREFITHDGPGCDVHGDDIGPIWMEGDNE